MSFVVKKLNGRRSWKLQFETKTGQRRSRDIPESELPGLGLSTGLSIDDARAICKSLNARERVKAIALKRAIIAHRLTEEELQINAAFPGPLLAEFERLFIPKDGRKLESHWRCAKRLIVKINLPIEDWAYHKQQFYKAFEHENYGYSYVQKLLAVLNNWGRFMARKQGKFYEPISAPIARDREKLVDNHADEKGQFSSEPITPGLLESAHSNLLEANYNWIYLSVWLGLRPSEVDRLHQPEGPRTWQMKVGAPPVLWLYQSKLVGIAASERLKPIPLLVQEQVRCLGIIQSGKFKRPLVKTLKKYIGPEVNCYGGRKGFTDLMLGQGYSLEAISQWLGHRNINRTWQSYKSKKLVLFK